jgi:hypothetical protein
LGKTKRALGKRAGRVAVGDEGSGIGIDRRAGQKMAALEPRPWRRTKVCLWGEEMGGMINGSGKAGGRDILW